MIEPAEEIKFSAHAQDRCHSRGCTKAEVIETIKSSKWEKAELGKWKCRRDFLFNSSWQGKAYKTKQVSPIFTEEGNEIIVITVYVYYF